MDPNPGAFHKLLRRPPLPAPAPTPPPCDDNLTSCVVANYSENGGGVHPHRIGGLGLLTTTTFLTVSRLAAATLHFISFSLTSGGTTYHRGVTPVLYSTLPQSGERTPAPSTVSFAWLQPHFILISGRANHNTGVTTVLYSTLYFQ